MFPGELGLLGSGNLVVRWGVEPRRKDGDLQTKRLKQEW